ncbi:MAG: tRNA (guanosine(46)-N7)-methyltransferase TrmB [Tenericutes bacterium]|nr:tRNA (guanosine(46)-N7)-methyltransferase TrmB [Bacilli bacterium]NLV89998.1 tRNA (guanosine(46)-N7)-methyltransferase TrmB [Mycoplasmatota bacterium]
MRLRNIKGAKEIVQNSKYIVNNYKEYKGKWNKIFDNNNPIHLEIGMGKGKFILENALKNPNINYIGIEKYDSVLYKAIKKIDEVNINNLKIISCDALELMDIFNSEIDCIYLNFSDPWHKDRHSKRRLTSEVYLNIYDSIFKNNNHIILKTDNRNLFEFSIETLSMDRYIFKEVNLDLHNSNIRDIITTEYEDKFVSKGNIIYMFDAYKLK